MLCFGLPALSCITAVMQPSKFACCLYAFIDAQARTYHARTERMPREAWTKLATVLDNLQLAPVSMVHTHSLWFARQGMMCRPTIVRTWKPTRRDRARNGCARYTHKSLKGNNLAIPPRTTNTATAKFTMRLQNELASTFNSPEFLSKAAA
jgi:hypothetical protein